MIMTLRPYGNFETQSEATWFKEEDKKIYTKTERNYRKIARLESTINGDVSVYGSTLPTDYDIFSNLPQSVYENDDVRFFLECLRRALLKKLSEGEIENVSLTKLRLSEQSDGSITIDWIFSYFRLFFSFDLTEGNMCGIVEINNEQKRYITDVQEIDMINCDCFTGSILDYVIVMLT